MPLYELVETLRYFALGVFWLTRRQTVEHFTDTRDEDFAAFTKETL